VVYLAKHWKWQEKGENIHLYCPILSKGVSDFKTLREIYKELHELEATMVGVYPNSVMYTRVEHPHIIKIMTKLGYKPYFVNLDKETIWFKKPLRR
jgi:hypothetical protein